MARIGPSAAVLAARSRATGAAGARDVRIESFVKKVEAKVSLTLKQRMQLATEHLWSTTVRNISKAVGKSSGPRSGRVVVTERSRPGEFPRADTTQLMKTLFREVRSLNKGVVEGVVGTPTNYGLILETSMNRSFLVRSLNEQRGRITRMITTPKIR